MTKLLLAHLSDTHVGYRAYRPVAPSGRNQREEDFVRAFHQACDDIIARDVPLVVHSGDVADTPTISYRLVKELRDGLRRMAGVRPDGTRRQVVVVAGNHDLPGSRHDTCFLDLYDDIPGVHVITGEYRRVTFNASDGADPVLADVVIHAIDHDSLATVDFDQVAPMAGKTNVLLTHGTAGGTDLYRRCVGREYTIPIEVLQRGWSYGALGHWHKQGPVVVDDPGAFGRLDPLRRGRIWYAGSTENSGLGDLADNGDERGYLLVRLDTSTPDALPEVEAVMLPIRAMRRLPDVDATGLAPHQVQQALVAQLRELDATVGVAGAVVAQRVTGCGRALWSLVDVAAVRAAAARALHHDLRLVATTAGAADPVGGDDDTHSTHGGDVEAEIDAAARRLLPEAQQTPVATRAKGHLRRRRGGDSGVRDAADTTDTADTAVGDGGSISGRTEAADVTAVAVARGGATLAS
jgi:DNA repair protein SbcD/Mre11